MPQVVGWQLSQLLDAERDDSPPHQGFCTGAKLSCPGDRCGDALKIHAYIYTHIYGCGSKPVLSRAPTLCYKPLLRALCYPLLQTLVADLYYMYERAIAHIGMKLRSCICRSRSQSKCPAFRARGLWRIHSAFRENGHVLESLGSNARGVELASVISRSVPANSHGWRALPGLTTMMLAGLLTGVGMNPA